MRRNVDEDAPLPVDEAKTMFARRTAELEGKEVAWELEPAEYGLRFRGKERPAARLPSCWNHPCKQGRDGRRSSLSYPCCRYSDCFGIPPRSICLVIRTHDVQEAKRAACTSQAAMILRVPTAHLVCQLLGPTHRTQAAKNPSIRPPRPTPGG